VGGLDEDPATKQLPHVKALEFITGYLVEEALAVENIFVFLMLFTSKPGESASAFPFEPKERPEPDPEPEPSSDRG
jgi:hypothetical protein